MTAKVYDANEVSVIFGAIQLESGFADGEFVRIERETDAFSDVVGTLGEVTRSKTNDSRATITILLMQTSSGNQALSAQHNLDKLASNGAGIVPVMIRDRNGAAIHEGQNAWIAKAPDVSYDRAAGPREWRIRVANLESNDAGT